jgi:hypothetical protein
MVTVFLITTALLNIGVGYWLAIYLRRSAVFGELAPADDHALETLHDLDVHAAEPIPAAMKVTAPAAAPTGVAAAPSAAVPTPAAGEEQLEQDVLAGIEEFRNQLAQMKSRGEGEAPTSAATPAAADPAAAPA